MADVVRPSTVHDPHRGWFTAANPIGSWISLSWSRPHDLQRIVLGRTSLGDRGILGGFLTFGDGSRLEVTLSTTSPLTAISFTPRSVDRVRFTIAAASAGAARVGLLSIRVDDTPQVGAVATNAPSDGNVAASARLSTSRAAAARGLGALVDGVTAGPTGKTWTITQPVGASVILQWDAPRELNSISVTGSASPALLRSGTLYFSDGSNVALGAVLPSSVRPTVVSFMPRSTTSVRLVIDTVTGSGSLSLADFSAFQVGAPPHQGAGGTSTGAVPLPSCDTSVARPAIAADISVRCPVNGSSVDKTFDLRVALGASYTALNATLLPAQASVAASPPVNVAVSSQGMAAGTLRVSSLPAGPFTVMLDAFSSTLPTKRVFFQLNRNGLAPGATLSTVGSPAAGRSLVYSEEFTRPLSASRTGENVDYSASKPQVSTTEDFGDAIFADPASGLGNEQVVDNQYLQISVQPKPATYADPEGWGRNYVGGLLASARPGGSGFSAQYGYFEARMLAPVAPGTWPAFWMLPNPNLVSPETAVAEVDAVELYGQFPMGSCSSTHQYFQGKDGGIANCSDARLPTYHAALQWHTYGVAIDPTIISFYIDKKLVATAPQVMGGGDPMFFMVNLALGGGWPIDLAPTGGRVALYVDNIRVYE